MNITSLMMCNNFSTDGDIYSILGRVFLSSVHRNQCLSFSQIVTVTVTSTVTVTVSDIVTSVTVTYIVAVIAIVTVSAVVHRISTLITTSQLLQ